MLTFRELFLKKTDNCAKHLRDVVVQYTSCSDVLVSPVALCALGALMACIHAPPQERPQLGVIVPVECLPVRVSDCTLNMPLAYFIANCDSGLTSVFAAMKVRVCARLRGRMFLILLHFFVRGIFALKNAE